VWDLSIGPAGVPARLPWGAIKKTWRDRCARKNIIYNTNVLMSNHLAGAFLMSPTLDPQIRSEESQVRAVLAAVRRIMHAADLRSRRLARETGLTAPQLAILQAIADLGEVTTGRISADVSLSQATVTVILDRLLERNLIERYRSADDRRIVHTRLTEAGQQALAAAGPAINTRLVAEFKRMQASEQAELVAALEWNARALAVPDEAWPAADAVNPPTKL